jgi:hypothetical protein
MKTIIHILGIVASGLLLGACIAPMFINIIVSYVHYKNALPNNARVIQVDNVASDQVPLIAYTVNGKEYKAIPNIKFKSSGKNFQVGQDLSIRYTAQNPQESFLEGDNYGEDFMIGFAIGLGIFISILVGTIAFLGKLLVTTFRRPKEQPAT